MCNCVGVVRTFEETQGGRFPPSDHAPMCEDYHEERFIRLFDLNGTSFIDTVENQYVVMSNEGGWRQEDVYLTRDQFEKLEECNSF